MNRTTRRLPHPKLDGGDVTTNTISSHTSNVVIAFALAIRAGK
jgi:Zn-dependent protease